MERAAVTAPRSQARRAPAADSVRQPYALPTDECGHVGDRELRRLTSDLYAAHRPAWSPDGRRLAFATDRFTTDLETLAVSTLEIAAIEVDSGRVTRLAAFGGAKNIDPHWSSDGRSVYYLSDRDGITNIYRTSVDGGATWQVTNIATGVAGISAESPALSVAAAADRLVFSAFEGADYNIYTMSGERTAGGPLVSTPEGLNAAVLPPRREGAGAIFTLLEQPAVGLPPAQDFPIEPYRARLSLDFIGQPTLAVGVDRFGAFLGGGIVAFADAGVAWGRGTRPAFFGGDIDPVTSAGFGIRANVFGFVILELDLVRPFDRPQPGWMWQFGFTPGF